ncbi:MAG: four helix bundle protein [Lachnospiraceae bacterium]|nr:four helix bundle protein [Lachnospiraceae bacterium]
MVYQDLNVWKKSMELVKNTYQLMKKLPKEETYALSDQIRRAAVSIPSNIADGYGRGSTKEYVRYLNISRGSKNELETHLQICVLLEYLTDEDIEPLMNLCGDIGRMLAAMIKKLEKPSF